MLFEEQKLTLDMDTAICSRRPAEFHSFPVRGPKPIEIPIPARPYKTPKHERGLIMVPDRKVGFFSSILFKYIRRMNEKSMNS
ncbi:unnamed protein product [Toxocara canis]|uniref:Uncharacterized protein n=1 Tax=Toxocara canis TaxID=6265 RepID=A0A183U806_TOXCA|nr:unnamed protein product [Toxocara canis]